MLTALLEIPCRGDHILDSPHDVSTPSDHGDPSRRFRILYRWRRRHCNDRFRQFSLGSWSTLPRLKETHDGVSSPHGDRFSAGNVTLCHDVFTPVLQSKGVAHPQLHMTDSAVYPETIRIAIAMFCGAPAGQLRKNSI